MLSDLGTKISKFVAAKRLRKRIAVPFQSVIVADHQFAIFDNMDKFKPFQPASLLQGLDLDHAKVALQSLAKLHAMSFAYFNTEDDGVDALTFSQSLLMLIDRKYQPSASQESIQEAQSELEDDFHKILSVVARTDPKMAEQLERRFSGRLFGIFQSALTSDGSNFNVLCHGSSTPDKFSFFYEKVTEMGTGGMEGATPFVNFELAPIIQINHIN